MEGRFTKEYIRELAYKWEKGSMSPSERADFEEWYNSHDDTWAELPADYDKEEAIRNRLLAHLESYMDQEQSGKIVALGKRRTWIAAASIILIACSLGIYLYVADVGIDRTDVREPANVSTDVEPGGNKAILTLADGRKIMLDEAADGELAEESGIKITKTADGQIVYEVLRHAPQARASEEGQPKAGSAGWRASLTRAPATYNTIQTPRGGQYKIILPDSSIVWLNAASSLRYPTRFAGAERRVELTGEAYFSVTKSLSPFGGGRGRNVPFLVVSGGQIVEVLGTQFNINAYSDEPVVRTTLLEGSVAVRVASTSVQSTNKPTNPPVVGHGQSTTLRPGQQSTLLGNSLAVVAVDVEEALAWKNGQIYFRDAGIEEIMRQVSRWYDVDIAYEGAVTKDRFAGGVSRSSNLSTLLDILRDSHIHFRMEEQNGKKTLVVTP